VDRQARDGGGEIASLEVVVATMTRHERHFVESKARSNLTGYLVNLQSTPSPLQGSKFLELLHASLLHVDILEILPCIYSTPDVPDTIEVVAPSFHLLSRLAIFRGFDRTLRSLRVLRKAPLTLSLALTLLPLYFLVLLRCEGGDPH
jgi:hypothetical protein